MRRWRNAEAWATPTEEIDAPTPVLSGKLTVQEYLGAPLEVGSGVAGLGVQVGLSPLQPAVGCSPERSVARCMTMRAAPNSLYWTLIPHAQPDLVEEVRQMQERNLERVVVCESAVVFFGEDVERVRPSGKFDRIVLWPMADGAGAQSEREAFLRAYELLAPGGKLVAALDKEAIDDASTGLRAWAAKKGATFDQPANAFHKLGLVLVTLHAGLKA